MIEFKAECGHTVRAKDSDAGKVVRCSYCGKPADVPQDKEDEIDFLLSEVDRVTDQGGALAAAPPSKKRRRKAAKPMIGSRRPNEINPFAVALKLGYVAVGLIIVIFVYKTYVHPAITGGGGNPPVNNTTYGQPKRPEGSGVVVQGLGDQRNSGSQRTAGLLSLVGDFGLYVDIVPAGATLHYIRVSSSTDNLRRGQTLFDSPHGESIPPSGQVADLEAGHYIVEAVFEWNSKEMFSYPEYGQFRHSIMDASSDARMRMMDTYFLPDESIRTFVKETEEQIYLVRQYRAQVREGKWEAVRGWFLPRLMSDDESAFNLSAITAFVPSNKVYTFDEDLVRHELEFYQVPPTNWQFMLDMLGSMGVAPQVTKSNELRLFKIDVSTGSFGKKDVKRLDVKE